METDETQGMMIKDLLLAFEAHLRSEGREERTIRSYSAELQSIFGRLRMSHSELQSITTADLIGLRSEWLARDVKPATINKRLSMLRSFFRWAASRGLADSAVSDG